MSRTERSAPVTALHRLRKIFWRGGRLTWRGWLLLGLAAFYALVYAFGPRWWPPGAKTYCDAMVTRGLVRDCVKDPSPPHGATSSVQFTVASSGKLGRVSRFPNADDYWRELHRWEALEKSRDVALLGYGRALVLGLVPGPFDAVEKEDFGHFHNTDMEAITVGRPLDWWGTREHPVHSDACSRSPACAEEGRCAVRPSAPDECIAGFDKDCMASAICVSKKLCHAWATPPFTCVY